MNNNKQLTKNTKDKEDYIQFKITIFSLITGHSNKSKAQYLISDVF